MEEKNRISSAWSSRWIALFCLLGLLVVGEALGYSSSSFASPQKMSFQAQTRVTERRLRIQRIVMGLDAIGDVTTQMMPENADRIEPVLEALEDRAVGLSAQGEIEKISVDDELSKIEGSLQKLNHVISRMVEPELTL